MRGKYLLYLTGVLVAVMGFLFVPATGQAAYGDYSSTISTGGLNQPAKVALDAAGNVYVTDAGSKAVKKFDISGTYDSGFSLSVAGTPVGIAVNGSNIFVGDDTNNCVWIYDTSGTLTDLSGTGSTHKLGGASGASLAMPNTITLAPSGHIFVVDGDNDKVRIYNANGTTNSSFGVSDSAAPSGTTIPTYYPSGLAMAESSTASGIVTQYFWLGDQGNNRAMKLYYRYNESSKLITTAPTYASVACGGKGDNFGNFLRLSDLAWDSNMSRLMVVDSLQMVAQMFQSNGALVSPNDALNYNGSVEGHLNVPTGMAVDATNQVAYVVSNQDDSIAVFDLTPPYFAPTVAVSSPATFLTYSTCADSTWSTINYTTTDSDSGTVTTYLFYDSDTNWSNGTSSILPGTGEGLIGSSSAAPGAGNMNWAIITLPPGTYYVRALVRDERGLNGEGYSAGTITVGDSDADGLNNIFEDCYGDLTPGSDGDVDGLTALEEQALGTNPTDADTDGGGTRDGVEVGMGTVPGMGNEADDLASTPVLTGIYHNVQAGSGWTTWYVVSNKDAVNESYIDVCVYNLNGGHLSTEYYTVPPRGQVKIDPYTIPEVIADATLVGNIEVRCGGGDPYGFATQEMWNAGTPTSMDYCYSSRMAAVADAAQILYSSYWNTSPGVWDTWMTVKNVSESQVSIAAEFWDPSGVTKLYTKTRNIAAHASWAFTPRQWIAPETNPTGNCIVTVTAGTGKIVGYTAQYFLNQTVPSVIDYGYTTVMGTFATLMTDMAAVKWSCEDATVSDTWYSVFNPGTASATITIKYYDMAGNLLKSRNRPVTPKKTGAWSPHIEAEIGWVPDFGSMEVTVVGSEVVGYIGEMWFNSYDPAIVDYGFAHNFQAITDAKDTLYAPSLKKGMDGWDTEIALKNCNDNPVTAYLYFYNTDGTEVETNTQVLPAHGMAVVDTSTLDFGAATEVSMRVDTSGGALLGYFRGTRDDPVTDNPDVSPMYEGNFGDNLQ